MGLARGVGLWSTGGDTACCSGFGVFAVDLEGFVPSMLSLFVILA